MSNQTLDADTHTMLAVHLELSGLRKENRELRQENARLKAERTDFELSADSTPCLIRKQAG